MKKTVLFLAIFCALGTNNLWAQITITTGVTAAQIANNIAGAGVTIAVVSEARKAATPAKQVGTYTANVAYQIPITSGVILTCGDATLIPGGNKSGGSSDRGLLGGSGASPDADLQALTTATIYDMYTIEFDIINITFDTLVIQYAFGSEEYLEFVGNTYNDAFGFFIKGNEYPTYKNFAVVPGTVSQPVNINDINTTSNPAYFINNTGGASGNPNVCEYDGFTKVLKAKIKVTPGKTYRIKIGIADASDGALDSGVFIQASTITNNAVVLPISLLGFTAERDNTKRKNIIHWKTAQEKENNYFELLKRTDNTAFQVIAKINGNGNSLSAHDYEYIDDQTTGDGVSYYMLRQVDFNGKMAVSNVLSISNHLNIQVKDIFPNPVGGKFSAKVEMPADAADAKAEIIDVTGRTMLTQPLTLQAGINDITINTEELQTGTYFFRIVDGVNTCALQRIVK